VERVAPTDTTVLVVGETGTGKELVARTLHRLSKRHEGPFVAVNCGAISPSLMESELFGHEKGSFTGAQKQHRGVFERANGGTLFLDEVTEMPPELQVKLLRVLETMRVRRVGGDRTFTVDVRIVASTNRKPEEAISDGSLREDLHYRLSVFPITLPPLRDRNEDIRLLAEFFVERLNRESKQKKLLGPGAIDALQRHAWPGNVRELANAMERSHILADRVIGARTLETAIQNRQSPERVEDDPFEGELTIAEMERQHILATLERYEDNKKEAAKALGISLKTLYNRLKRYRNA
jgi:transcriptional regulator with PAS, ATPase and Fis domain